MINGAFATPKSHASPTTVRNAITSTVGGCQTAQIKEIISCTARERLTPEVPLLLQLNPTGTWIVVLGAALNNDGSMKPILITRLQAALSLARTFPSSSIITTGGLPHAGRTEAQAMKWWLAGNGVAAGRIATEDRSRTTVENAQNTAPMLAAGRAWAAVIVSSPDHVQRAMVDFREAVRGSIPIAGMIAGYTTGAPVPGATGSLGTLGALGMTGSGSGSLGSS